MDHDFGCTDGSCPFASRLGMHTNGGCKCVWERFPDEDTRRLVERMLRRAREVAAADGRLIGQRDAPEVAVAVQKFLARVLDLPRREARRVVEAELRRLAAVRDEEATRPAAEACCPKCFAPANLEVDPSGNIFECGTIRTSKGLHLDDRCRAGEKAYLRGLRHRMEPG